MREFRRAEKRGFIDDPKESLTGTGYSSSAEDGVVTAPALPRFGPATLLHLSRFPGTRHSVFGPSSFSPLREQILSGLAGGSLCA